MIVKFVFVSVIICIFSNCFANYSSNECLSEDWKRSGKLTLTCNKFRKFESCANEIAPNGNATEVHAMCLLNKFPTELFDAFRSMKGLLVYEPPHLTQRDLLGANQLENLVLESGKLNFSASTFVNAPKLKAIGIKYCHVDYIDPQTFNGASALRTLILRIQPNVSLPVGLFDGLTNLKVLDYGVEFAMNEIDMETLRIPVDNNIKLFKLVSSNHTALKAEMFINFTKLTMLLLRYNGIYGIQPYTFAMMNQLILLDLSNNKIEELTQTMLAGLTNLRTANFRSNEIRHIESESFSSTPQLRRLDLSKNKMLSFEPHTFNILLKIRYLDLSFGSVNQSTFMWFCNLRNLSYANLRQMGISKLNKCAQNSRTPIDIMPDETTFNTTETAELLSEWQYLEHGLFYWKNVIDLDFIEGMKYENEFTELLDGPRNISAGGNKLDILDLSRNRLSDWEDNLFDDFINLRVLKLDYNPIESLRSGQFNGLGNLLILRLDYCELTSLDFNNFSQLPNLRNLHLAYNRIATITPPAMLMNRLTFLDLGGNYIPRTALYTDAFRDSLNPDVWYGAKFIIDNTR